MVRREEKEYNGIKYLLYYPKDYQEGKKYPVMFHLAGAGSRGHSFSDFEETSIILQTLTKQDSPISKGFCVFPLCEDDTWYDRFEKLLDLVKHIYNSSFTDKNRFNGSGISMGGYAMYTVMMCLPELFNKAIICCGGGMYWNAGRLKNIKLRLFHGEKDEAVFPEEARRMYKRLKDNGADVTLTIYPECDHNCWEKTYLNYENLDWLFA